MYTNYNLQMFLFFLFFTFCKFVDSIDTIYRGFCLLAISIYGWLESVKFCSRDYMLIPVYISAGNNYAYIDNIRYFVIFHQNDI